MKTYKLTLLTKHKDPIMGRMEIDSTSIEATDRKSGLKIGRTMLNQMRFFGNPFRLKEVKPTT